MLSTMTSQSQQQQQQQLQFIRPQRSGRSNSHSSSPPSKPLPEHPQRQLQQQVLVDERVHALDSAAAEERNQAIQKVAQDMQTLNALFMDMALMVDEQTVLIDRIDVNIEQTQSRTTQAVEELKGAAKSQRRTRKLVIGATTTVLTAAGVVALLAAFKPRIFS
jgi:syntaxin 1B/2/3